MNTKQQNPQQTKRNDNELTDDDLDQDNGGTGLLSSPLGNKLKKPTTPMWTREIVEDVEAY